MANDLSEILQAGANAPDFTLPSDGDGSATLSEYRGQYVVLYFYPKDDTPGCTKEACDFRDATDDLDGAIVLGVSPDTTRKHDKFKAKYTLNFPLLADTDNEVAKAYGVWQLKKNYGKEYMGIVRSTFLIAPDGTIAEAWTKVRVHVKQKDGSVKRHVDAVKAALDTHCA